MTKFLTAVRQAKHKVNPKLKFQNKGFDICPAPKLKSSGIPLKRENLCLFWIFYFDIWIYLAF
jgi:hypothetical protein